MPKIPLPVRQGEFFVHKNRGNWGKEPALDLTKI